MKYQYWLGCDPGTASFGISVIRYNPETGGIKILYVTILDNPIKNLTETPVRPKNRRGKSTLERDEPSFAIGARLFLDEIEWILDTFKITHIAGERFQSRGVTKGDVIEAVNIMLGIITLLAIKRGITFVTITAGVWKNAMARLGVDLTSAYEHGKVKYRIPAHLIDASLIALWHINRDIVWSIPRLLKTINKLIAKSA